ncbi:hypothetical protein K491DRAFT_691410 [Lophiostoma macrostomum CBS 122681]|uniref:Uncharacterized protein n=1 Tax=Lophiostoma macrostomum CBS 122681 TaxID=1314788 RepID=A0A6A6TBM6_9PLEO|nr:hypothetical protein K491DRAFT_691410 [Lophiostoma macrostomum CBS 122681]
MRLSYQGAALTTLQFSRLWSAKAEDEHSTIAYPTLPIKPLLGSTPAAKERLPSKPLSSSDVLSCQCRRPKNIDSGHIIKNDAVAKAQRTYK